MMRSYYSEKLSEFLNADDDKILVQLCDNDMFDPDKKQNEAWKKQIEILQDQLRELGSGHIMFEYTIPRMGKRVDTVLIYSDFVFVMEFKVNQNKYNKGDKDQCIDYALDLKNFHEESHCASIVPILISTDAKSKDVDINKCKDGIYDIAYANKNEIINIIKRICNEKPDCNITALKWENSEYHPTPTITEAATALCSNISGLDDITRSDADAKNLNVTTNTINKIIDESKKTNSKSICFLTGVPGSGKTLAALNLVCSKVGQEHEQSIMLSGNMTLVDVLKESLKKGGDCMKGYEGAAAASLIQHISRFRSSCMRDEPPIERIIVFDEAQRAWSAKKLNTARDKDQDYSNMSDPELLINAMNKHLGWAVIVCLIGEGQEIYNGEVGLSGWLKEINEKYSEWHVYHSNEIENSIDVDESLSDLLDGVVHETYSGLHLDTSIRSFRGKNFATMINEILDCNVIDACKTWKSLKDQYPVVITRDIKKAKQWIREQARGTERYGLVASSGADRLSPHGIFVRAKIKATKWFLADKEDMRSSYYLEYAATEFYIQGLELDWVCLAWDANLRYKNGAWTHHIFHGNNWRNIKQERERNHLINAYRVLLTRARQGMVIFIPSGDSVDSTRKPEFYDGTYNYLKSIGFDEI